MMNQLRNQAPLPQATNGGNNGRRQRTPRGSKGLVSKSVHMAPVDQAPTYQPHVPKPPYTPNTVAQLDLKQKTKHPKLLSSKSLSQLIPRNLFFKKSNVSKAEQQVDNMSGHTNTLMTTKSFPSAGFRPNAVQVMNNNTPDMVNRLDSDSLIVLPRHSSSSYIGGQQQQSMGVNCPFEPTNLSPIVGQSCEQGDTSTRESPIDAALNQESQAATGGGQSQLDEKTEVGKKKTSGGRYKPFKNTTLVLRDVKNSIGLVSCANQCISQAYWLAWVAVWSH